MRSTQSWAVIVTIVSVAAGCKGAGAVTGSIDALGANAIVDKQTSGSVGLDVDGDGQVRAAVADPDGKPLTPTASGSVVFKTASGATQTVALAPDAKTGLLVGAGPKLEGLTEVDYTLAAAGKPLSGTVYVPATGTATLAAAAKTNAQAATQAGDARGPHGGVVQVVGTDRLEIAATAGGEVRVYVLDAELHPVVVGPRKIVLGVQAERPELVVLTPDPTGRFLTGHWSVRADPTRITVHEEIGADVHVVVVGAAFGGVVVVGPGAPHVKVVVVERWDDDDVDVHVAGRGGPKWHVEGHDDDEGHGGVRVQINGGPHGKVRIK